MVSMSHLHTHRQTGFRPWRSNLPHFAPPYPTTSLKQADTAMKQVLSSAIPPVQDTSLMVGEGGGEVASVRLLQPHFATITAPGGRRSESRTLQWG